MEIPCQLLFSGEEIDVRKLQRLLPASDSVCTMGQIYKAENGEKEPKRIKLEQEGDDAGTTTTTITFASYSLSSYDLQILSSGRNLSDQHINYGQELIKKGVGTQIHPRQKRSYMYSYPEADRNGNFVQTMHLPLKNGSGHWILASNVGGQTDEVTVYDSLYNTVNTYMYTRNLLNRLLKNNRLKVILVRLRIQNGCNYCGLFTLAFGVALANGEDLTSNTKFDQIAMGSSFALKTSKWSLLQS